MREDPVPADELAAVATFIRDKFFPLGSFNAQDIYAAKPGAAYPLIADGVYDHTMYVALSRMVKAGELAGPDPYGKEKVQSFHDEWFYTVRTSMVKCEDAEDCYILYCLGRPILHGTKRDCERKIKSVGR